jgi:hypothetical protein
MRLVLSFIAALILIPVALAYTAFSDRQTAIHCARSGGHVSCSDRETIGPYVAWSKTVEDIAIARDMSQSDSSGNQGVVAQTESGDEVELTSTFLDDKQQADISNRLQDFIFINSSQSSLDFSVPPSLLNLALGAGFSVVLVIWALYGVVRIVQRIFGGRRG